MEKLRILEVTTSYPRFKGDYAGLFILRLDRELVKAGLDVTVLAPAAPGYPGEETVDGVKVRRVRYFFPEGAQTLAYGYGIKGNIIWRPWVLLQMPLLFISLLANMARYGRKADIIHCHMLPVGLLGVMLKPFLGKPVIVTPWGTDYRDLPKALGKAVLGGVDLAVSTATETTRYFEGIGFTRFEWIPTPIDEDEFNPGISAGVVTSELGLKDALTVSFIGRLTKIKGPQTLIRAVPLVLERMPGVRFLIVGDGDEAGKLKVSAAESGVESAVIFTGARSDVARLLRASTVFTALSPVENTWSTSIAEAMFMGVPMILTDAGYTREFFTHLKDCYLVPPEDPEKLADAICLMLNDKGLRDRLAKGSYELLDKSGKRRADIVAKAVSVYRRVAHRGH